MYVQLRGGCQHIFKAYDIATAPILLANTHRSTIVEVYYPRKMPSSFLKKIGLSKSPIKEHGGRVQGSVPVVPTAPQTTDPAITPLGHDKIQENGVRNLWREAFTSLPQDDREILPVPDGDGTPGDKASHLAAVERVKELTEVKYEEYCKRGWHTKKGDTTKETNIKIKAQDIMCAALKFDSIVKAGLKFDPSGYGATVWGVLSGVLTLVQNDKDRADAVFDSVEVLARFLPKYAIIEDHYLDRKTQHRNRFEDQIKNVYISILKYAACVQKELNRSLPGKQDSPRRSFYHQAPKD